MKRRTIQKVIRRKFDDWVKSIREPRVQELVKKNSIVSGGCITSMLLNEKVNDYDIYFTDRNTAQAVAEYYVNWFNEYGKTKAYVQVGPGEPPKEGEEYDETVFYKPHYEPNRVSIFIPSAGVAGEPQAGIAGETLDQDVEEYEEGEGGIDIMPDCSTKYRPVFLSQNAITLTNGIQLVVRFHGLPEEIHKNFDFVHCKNHWLSTTGKVYFGWGALEAILTKELVYIGSLYPVCSILRTRKFIKRGWSITAGTYLKMILQCNDLDLHDINVLEEQLIGVDSAYFMQLISALKKVDRDDSRMSTPYISEILDRIFG